MANRPAPELVLREGDLEVLESWLRATTVPAGLARRARIVLLAAQGMANSRIAQAVGISVPTVVSWQRRYQAGGVRRLEDAPRSGRPGQVPRERVVAATLAPPPKRYGVTHWSSRLLARHLGIGNATVARVWRSYGIQPWRSGTFKYSTDPELVGRVTDVVGLYLAPRTTPWCCASTRSPRSRTWTAPPRCCPCSRAGSSGAPTTPLRRWHAHPPRRVRSRLGLRHQPRSPGTVITGHHWSQINRPPQNPSLDVPVCFNWGGFGQESTGTPTGIRTQDHVLIRHARGISSLL